MVRGVRAMKVKNQVAISEQYVEGPSIWLRALFLSPFCHDGHAPGAKKHGGEREHLKLDASLQLGPHEVGGEEIHERRVVEKPRGRRIQQPHHDERGGAVVAVHVRQRDSKRNPKRRRGGEEEDEDGFHLHPVFGLQIQSAEHEIRRDRKIVLV